MAEPITAVTGTTSAPAASSGSKVSHPPWHGPHGSSHIMVHNSLTSTTVPFLAATNAVSITFDIIRRILCDYFKYNIFYVMNITDLDDKIIIRSRRNHLLKNYTATATDGVVVQKDIDEAFQASIKKQSDKVSKSEQAYKDALVSNKYVDDSKTEMDEEKAKLTLLGNEQKSYMEEAEATRAAGLQGQALCGKLIASGKGVLSELLDARHGGDVTDHSIFKAHAAYYEKEFLEDMRALGVRDADALTRVTEYVEHIVKYVEGIIKNGYAYEANGSVYFDTAKFSQDGFHYAKLSPWSVGNTNLTNAGEGALSTDSLGRKSGMDFALWKTSKKGEPAWESPWGKGRPGWHIECSAMAGDMLGRTFDIHSGGTDLKFPHHDNEIAQSESHGKCQQWVNHFWHAGHLNIAGLKMSKSLKNFITIRDVLKNVSGRVVRFLFLLTPWDTSMNFSDDSLRAAATREKEFTEFFGNTAIAIRSKPIESTIQIWNEIDRNIHTKLVNTRNVVDVALRSNFDYPAAMNSLTELILETNKYRLVSDSKSMILSQIARYVNDMVRVFGVIPDPEPGFIQGGSDGKLSGVLDAVTAFRDAIRDGVRSKKTASEMLTLCDQFRDESMISIGVRLEDVALPGGGGAVKSVWKLDDPLKLLKERDDKRLAESENRINKLKNKIEKLSKDLLKFEENSIEPKDFFKTQLDKYSKFNDDDGKPTADEKGVELSKSALKSLTKIWETRDKNYKEYLNKISKEPDLINNLKKEIGEMKEEMEKLDGVAKQTQ